MTLTQEQFARFAHLSGDDNPIHLDAEFCARTRFGRPVAHGMFLYSLLTGLAGRFHPGSVQLQAEFTFRAPTYAGEPVHFSLAKIEPAPAQNLLAARLQVASDANEAGEPGLDGSLILLQPPFGPQEWHSSAALAAPAPPAAGGAETYKGLRLGQRAAVSRTYTRDDLEGYTRLASDPNPLYRSPDYARAQGLEDTPLPGPLLGGLFSYLLGVRLPGRGTNWLKQRLHFPGPAYPGQELSASVEVTRLRPEKELANLRTWCQDQTGEIVCEGEALVLIHDREV